MRQDSQFSIRSVFVISAVFFCLGIASHSLLQLQANLSVIRLVVFISIIVVLGSSAAYYLYQKYYLKPLKTLSECIDLRAQTVVTGRVDSSNAAVTILATKIEQLYRKLKHELVNSERRFMAADKHNQICIVDSNDIILKVNNRFAKKSGQDRSSILGRRIDYNFHPNKPDLWSQISDILIRGEIWRGTIVRLNHNNDVYFSQSTVVPFYDESEQYSHCILIETDVSDRVKAENELVELKNDLQHKVEQKVQELVNMKDIAYSAERSMAAFLSNISHELRTPIHGIQSFASFGIKKIDRVKKEKLVNYFEEIKDSSKALLDLVNDLLDLSRLKAGKVSYEHSEHSLNKLFDSILSSQQVKLQEKGLGIQLALDSTLDKLVFDKVKIYQVISKLLANAIEYSNRNTQISISNKVNFSSGFTVICISDQGIGVPENEAETIFDEFSQSSSTRSKAGGTGLGLAICKEIIVHGHGGKIWVENNSHRGASFFVQLPLNVSVSKEVA